jgi:hypothetical protein
MTIVAITGERKIAETCLGNWQRGRRGWSGRVRLGGRERGGGDLGLS